MGVIGLVKSIRCESTSEPAQDAPWWSEWPVSHQLHRTEDLLDPAKQLCFHVQMAEPAGFGLEFCPRWRG